MNQDILVFGLFFALLGIYLLWSAKTEMGTQWPWHQPEDKQ